MASDRHCGSVPLNPRHALWLSCRPGKGFAEFPGRLPQSVHAPAVNHFIASGITHWLLWTLSRLGIAFANIPARKGGGGRRVMPSPRGGPACLFDERLATLALCRRGPEHRGRWQSRIRRYRLSWPTILVVVGLFIAASGIRGINRSATRGLCTHSPGGPRLRHCFLPTCTARPPCCLAAGTAAGFRRPPGIRRCEAADRYVAWLADGTQLSSRTLSAWPVPGIPYRFADRDLFAAANPVRLVRDHRTAQALQAPYVALANGDLVGGQPVRLEPDGGRVGQTPRLRVQLEPPLIPVTGVGWRCGPIACTRLAI